MPEDGECGALTLYVLSQTEEGSNENNPIVLKPRLVAVCPGDVCKFSTEGRKRAYSTRFRAKAKTKYYTTSQA